MGIQIYGTESDRLFVRKCLSPEADNYNYVIETGRTADESEQQIHRITQGMDHSRQIIGFFRIFREQKVDSVMKHCEFAPDGLILGLSYSAFGINPARLPGRWLNLSVGSEDLYYHLCVLKKIIRVFPHRLTRLKTIIVDLYDDSCFHYDVSRSSAVIDYWGRRGFYEDKHHFGLNELFPGTPEEEMRAHNKLVPELSEEALKLRKKLFNEQYVMDHLHEAEAMIAPTLTGYDDYPFPEQFTGIVREDSVVEEKIRSRGSRFYPLTREENLDVVSDLIRTAKSIDSRMRIIFVHLPVWAGYQKVYARYFAKRAEEFNQDIGRFTSEDNVSYMDMRELAPFAGISEYFWDREHMNPTGATVFSDIMAQRLSQN